MITDSTSVLNTSQYYDSVDRLGTDCGTTSTITEKSNTQIEFDGRYDGDKVTSGDLKYQQCDRIIFQTKNYDEPDARYNICISPIYFNDRECAVTLDFKNSLFASPLKVINIADLYGQEYQYKDKKNQYIMLLIYTKFQSLVIQKQQHLAQRHLFPKNNPYWGQVHAYVDYL